MRLVDYSAGWRMGAGLIRARLDGEAPGCFEKLLNLCSKVVDLVSNSLMVFKNDD